jgi:peroxiredoxin
VSVDSPKANARFARLFDFEFQLLSDQDRSICVAYGALTPGSKGRADRIGLIIDPEGKVLQNFGKVSPTGFPDMALNFLPAPA